MQDLYKQLLEKMVEIRFTYNKVWLPGTIIPPGKAPITPSIPEIFLGLQDCRDRFPVEHWNHNYGAKFPPTASYATIATLMHQWIEQRGQDYQQKLQAARQSLAQPLSAEAEASPE